jgi:hypothetical protein
MLSTLTRASRTPRVLVGAFLLLLVGSGLQPGVLAQTGNCQRAELVSWASNIDLFVRCPSGAVVQVRVAGLQPWRNGWPLSDLLPEFVQNQMRGAALVLSPAPDERAPSTRAQLVQVALPNNRGSLAEIMARQGWAQVAADAGQTVPELSERLRASEAEARQVNRGVWSIVNNLDRYVAPGGGEVFTDRRLVRALDELARIEAGRPLLDNMAAHNIPAFMVPDLYVQGAWAVFDLSSSVVSIEASLAGADPRTVAAVVAHEFSHAWDFRTGLSREEVRTLGEEEACVQTELRAFTLETQLWLQWWGPEGKLPVRNSSELYSNDLLEQYLTSPDFFEDARRVAYSRHCRRFRLPEVPTPVATPSAGTPGAAGTPATGATPAAPSAAP